MLTNPTLSITNGIVNNLFCWRLLKNNLVDVGIVSVVVGFLGKPISNINFLWVVPSSCEGKLDDSRGRNQPPLIESVSRYGWYMIWVVSEKMLEGKRE